MDLQRNQLGLVGTPALLLIDMIEGFTDPSCPLGSDSERAVAAASSGMSRCGVKTSPTRST
jgi:hypothetical protein